MSERMILDACGLEEQQLRGSGALDRFRQVVARGHARCRADLQVEMKRRSERASKAAGSVNALALRARNLLDWDKQRVTEETESDLTSAKETLRTELQRLSANWSQVLGRAVAPVDVIFFDVYGHWPGRLHHLLATITLKDGLLDRALTIGEDDPTDLCPDAPDSIRAKRSGPE